MPDPRVKRKHPPLPPHHSATFLPTSDFFVSEQGETVSLGQVNLHHEAQLLKPHLETTNKTVRLFPGSPSFLIVLLHSRYCGRNDQKEHLKFSTSVGLMKK